MSENKKIEEIFEPPAPATNHEGGKCTNVGSGEKINNILEKDAGMHKDNKKKAKELPISDTETNINENSNSSKDRMIEEVKSLERISNAPKK